MIFVGIGANLPGVNGETALETCLAAIGALPGQGIRVRAVSPWYETAPVPVSDQPWYVNAVLDVVPDDPAPDAVMRALHAVEDVFGRRRGVVNAARSIDLDLLDHEGRVTGDSDWPVLPHPRMHQRAFVLLPLRDLDPHWRHPVLGRSVDAMIGDLPADQEIRPLRR